MIISCSRRTDVPAFYSRWLMNRLAAGYCTVVNPFNHRQVSRVSLQPSDVDAIVLWTKNAAPLAPHLPQIDALGHRYYFQYTVTGYGAPLEPYVPALETTTATFKRLSDRLGPSRVIWRYDPIVISAALDVAYHLKRFSHIADLLRGSTERVVISIVDHYRHVAKAMTNLGSIDLDASARWLREIRGMATTMAEIAHEHGCEIVSCAEPIRLEACGVGEGKCIDDALLTRLFGVRSQVGKDPAQRECCGCVQSRDIGAYDSCPHGCAYCYANRRQRRPSEAGSLDHHEDSPSLLGRFASTD